MAAAQEQQSYVDTSQLSPAEFGGMFASAILVLSLFLPWFGTSEDNENSGLVCGDGPDAVCEFSMGDTVTAWQIFGTLDFLLVAAASAPFILAWLIARGHKLTWLPGEVTMIVGITAAVLVLCNGIILGRPDPGIDISLKIGYLVALLASIGIAFSGYLRQSVYTQGRKPPGSV